MNPKMRRVFFPAEALELRAEGEEKRKKFSGIAVPYGKETQLWENFYERFAAGAFKEFLSKTHDVRALYNHNRDYVLGRTKSGTLALSEEDRGLRSEIDPPDTQMGRDLMVSVERGDIDGMSIGFYSTEERYIKVTEKKSVREVVKARLLDVSIVSFPAYPQTVVALRSIDGLEQLPEAELGQLVAAIDSGRELTAEQRSLSSRISDAVLKEFQALEPPAGPGLSNFKLRQALREKELV